MAVCPLTLSELVQIDGTGKKMIIPLPELCILSISFYMEVTIYELPVEFNLSGKLFRQHPGISQLSVVTLINI